MAPPAKLVKPASEWPQTEQVILTGSALVAVPARQGQFQRLTQVVYSQEKA